MIKLSKKQDVKSVKEMEKNLLWKIFKIMEILEENYGEERNVDNDLGGYILIVENIVDIEILKQDKLQGLIPEYTDIIECSEGVNWTSSLFLLSSDFAIIVVIEDDKYLYLKNWGERKKVWRNIRIIWS